MTFCMLHPIYLLPTLYIKLNLHDIGPQYDYSLKTNDWKVNLKDCGEGKVVIRLKIQSFV